MAKHPVEYDWGDVYAVALDPKTAGKEAHLKDHINFIHTRLDIPITSFRVSALNVGLDKDAIVVTQPGVDSQQPKVNHFACYFVHSMGQVCLSMENEKETEETTQGPGVLVVKFHDFTSASSASLITFDLPWIKGPGMTTVGDVIRALSAWRIDEFTMHEEKEGCRSAVDGLVKLFHEGGYTHLLGAHFRMGWAAEEPTDKTQAQIDTINKKRRKEMMGNWYYKLGGGVNRELKEGTYDNPLPNGADFKAWVEQQQPQS